MINPAAPNERTEQINFVRWFRLAHPGVRIMAIPNGVATNRLFGMALNEEGRCRGVPDLFIPEWLLWIEMKRANYKAAEKARPNSTQWHQQDWQEYLKSIGHYVYQANGFESAKDYIESHYNLYHP